MRKVSVIIPVYNAEKFIDRCINSVLDQTYKDIEVILINDGSQDSSLKIIEKYSMEHDNIHYFTQSNKGPGAARNKGIGLANGEYITFIDADDYIEKEYIKNLVSNSSNMDIVVCGYKRFDQGHHLILEQTPNENIISHFKFISTVCKLYNKNFLIDNNLKFSDRKIGEDMLFTLKCYSLTNKIKFIQSTGYCNEENLESITHVINSEKKVNMFDLVKEIDATIDLKKFGNLYLFFYLKTIIINLLMQPKTMIFKEYYQIYLESFQWLDQVYTRDNQKIKITWIKGEEFKINLCVNVFIVLRKVHLIKPFLFILKKINIRL